MEAIYGLALMSASILLLFYCAGLRNGPTRPGWTQSNVFVHTVLFTTVVGIIFGFSLLIRFGTHFSDVGFGPLEIGLLIAIAIATWAGWYGIRKMRAPLSTVEPSPTNDMPSAANSHGPRLRTGRKSGARGQKAA